MLFAGERKMKIMNYNVGINWYNIIVSSSALFVWVMNMVLIQKLIL